VNLTSKITKSLRKEDAQSDWWIVDAEGKTLGRLATQVAGLIRGKHKPTFTPHVDGGDFVIILNAEKIQLHSRRAEKKEYFHHTGYPGGGKMESFKTVINEKPEFAIRHAVRGMLPKTRLGNKMINKLKVYSGSEHPHAAQMPKVFELKYK
jgi:large subunit ribosomal protein L13